MSSDHGPDNSSSAASFPDDMSASSSNELKLGNVEEAALRNELTTLALDCCTPAETDRLMLPSGHCCHRSCRRDSGNGSDSPGSCSPACSDIGCELQLTDEFPEDSKQPLNLSSFDHNPLGWTGSGDSAVSCNSEPVTPPSVCIRLIDPENKSQYLSCGGFEPASSSSTHNLDSNDDSDHEHSVARGGPGACSSPRRVPASDSGIVDTQQLRTFTRNIEQPRPRSLTVCIDSRQGASTWRTCFASLDGGRSSKVTSVAGALDIERRWPSLTRLVPVVKGRKQERWTQLAGHEGSFEASEGGTILKLHCETENSALAKLMMDSLRPFVPTFRGIENVNGQKYIEMDNLLLGFISPCIMDCKMGVRTYLEDELGRPGEQPVPRRDMYEKMVQVDPNEPSEEEHTASAVTKPRYMQWRESISSSLTLGFRVEGVKSSTSIPMCDLKTCKDMTNLESLIESFINSNIATARQYLNRLTALRSAILLSDFFKTHEIVGSSLLFIHDDSRACVWMIDFGKTVPLPPGLKVTHCQPWVHGNHEDGYLIGLDSIISILASIVRRLTQTLAQIPVTSS